MKLKQLKTSYKYNNNLQKKIVKCYLIPQLLENNKKNKS
ncbi:hypothetical protein GM3709_3774 (plasmid) [Geminocystis sp. NIES-3709]|nr:hypothetical protein GM3709_3774 [Geminocystis sp. NIES-3709]